MKAMWNLSASILALAVVGYTTPVAAQSVPRTAKVVRMKGDVQYSLDGTQFKALKEGEKLNSGTVIKTGDNGKADLLLDGFEAPLNANQPVVPVLAYRSEAEPTADVVRVYPNTTISLDALTKMGTGSDEVMETKMDLRDGHIGGTVKKKSKASVYEVKIPNGVAAIRGTVYDLTAKGVCSVSSGGPITVSFTKDGSTTTQDVPAGFTYDATTGKLTQLPPKGELIRELNLMGKEMGAIPQGQGIAPTTAGAATADAIDQPGVPIPQTPTQPSDPYNSPSRGKGR